jgi:hypothetical protein
MYHLGIVYKSFNGRKIVDSVKQSSKEVKFELNGDGEGITESIGYVLSDEKQNYEKSFIEGYFEFEESEIDKSADKKLEKITDDVFVKIFNGTVNKNYSIEQTKTASGEHIEIVFASEKYLNECKKWLKDSWKKESKNMTINGNLFSYSDKRIKKNIEYLDGSLDKLKYMRGVTYNLIKDPSKKRQTGVIAQEIEQVLPEVIDNNGEYKTVAYPNMVAFLIEAIKDIDNKINIKKNL